MEEIKLSIITPTTGKNSLMDLIESVKEQNIAIEHILLWDDFREGSFGPNVGRADPKSLEQDRYWEEHKYLIKSIVIKGSMINGGATGSALRAIGLMAAKGEYVTFADDDIIWEPNHIASMLAAIKNKHWAYCKRRVWTKTPEGEYEFLGVDNFESVGENATTPYKMVDNNCMMFSRRFGTSGAVLYRETKEYNDDRLMYAFLKEHAGSPGITNEATVNQTCPAKLADFFRKNCTL